MPRCETCDGLMMAKKRVRCIHCKRMVCEGCRITYHLKTTCQITGKNVADDFKRAKAQAVKAGWGV